METNEKANPVAIGFLNAKAIALDSEGSFHPLHQFNRLYLCGFCAGFIYSFIKDGKSRKHANFGYAAKISFATSRINGVESKLVAGKSK
nr:hypothetical protein [Halomonas sp. HL-48]